MERFKARSIAAADWDPRRSLRHRVMTMAAAAVALGVALSPLASLLAFVDPGLAKDADCAALLAAAKTVDTQVPATSGTH